MGSFGSFGTWNIIITILLIIIIIGTILILIMILCRSAASHTTSPASPVHVSGTQVELHTDVFAIGASLITHHYQVHLPWSKSQQGSQASQKSGGSSRR